MTLPAAPWPPGGDPYIERAGCPHCGGRLGTDAAACCVCRGAGVLTFWPRLAAALANLWARQGCACRACRAVGRGPCR